MLLDMYVLKFIYDLQGRQQPTKEELDEDIDKLLLIKTAEVPDYLVTPENRSPTSAIDSEVISHWIRRKFEPTLIKLYLICEENSKAARKELNYKTWTDTFLKHKYVEQRAIERVNSLCFDDTEATAINKLKRVLTFLAKHLEENSPEFYTLQNTDAYSQPDISLYTYLRRISVGRYKDFGLKSHINLCEALIKFMDRYAKKNRYVINVSSMDSIQPVEDKSLLHDIKKPAIIVAAFLFLSLWRFRD